jgi:serine/threonine protein kinase
MHSVGMVHGDIKSLNVMLGEKGNAKLCDFGLTRMGLTTSAASTTSLGGTAAWCAPEILCEGQPHTFQSDIYSLGMLMYELLMCAPPFEGLPNNQISGLLDNKQRPPIPDTIPSGFSRAFVTLMTRCWDHDPAQRPSAGEVLRCMIDLDESTRPNEPVELFPSGHQLLGPSQRSIVPCLKHALPEACCDPVIKTIAAEAERSILTPSVQHMIAKHSLAALEAQSIFVYTASKGYAVCPTHNAPYVSYNAALRSLKPDSVSAWSDYSFLLYNALLKLPSVPCTVYRGLDCPLSDLSHLYWKGGFVWYAQPTSTTTDKEKTMKEFGEGKNNGAGTFMELRVKNAKEIVTFSAVPGEQERLIPQNTCFRVVQALSAADVKTLKGLWELPPNVDLVVLEEVRAAVVDV